MVSNEWLVMYQHYGDSKANLRKSTFKGVLDFDL